MVTESLKEAVLAKEYSQPQSSYVDAPTLTEFELKKILIDKMDKSQSYLTASKHIECYDGLIKSYDLDKSLFSTYGNVYSLKRSRNEKDKDKDPSAGSDRRLKKRTTSKDSEPRKGPKAKESQSGSSKGTKSQPKSSGKSVQSEEPEFEVVNSDMPQDQEENLGNDDVEPKEKVASKRPAFRLLKGTRSNYDELEYDFKECYKALSKKLNWENLKGGDYPFDLTKPLPLLMSRNHQKVPVDYFFNNDLKYLQGGILTMTYTTCLTKTKAAQYDLPGIEDMVPNIWVLVKVAYDKHALWVISHWREQRKSFYGYARGLQSTHDVYSTKRILVVTRVEVMRKHRYGYLKEILGRIAYNDLTDSRKEIFPRLVSMTSRTCFSWLMRSDELYKFSDRTLTGLRTSLDDITKNIRIEYLPKRRWSTLEKKRANIMIKAIDKQLKERRLMRSLEKFVGGRHYGTDLRLLQRTI
ncbi:hypothetical protein Tco_1193775 [Tanacetum coccineum]